MDFQRARTGEQKQSRRDMLVHIATEQFDKDGYDNLNLSAIAEQAGLTRPAIYRYFHNKEAILLRVMLKDFDDWSKDLVASFSSEKRYEVVEIADIWTASILSRERMLKLYSIYNAILEKNLSVDDLVDFEKSSLRAMQPVMKLVERLFPRATKEQVKGFLDVQLALAFGFYLTSHVGITRLEAAKLANTAFVVPSFTSSYRNNICRLMYYLE